MKDKKTILLMILGVVLILGIGITYAYFTSGVIKENQNDQIVTTGSLELTYTDGTEIILNDTYPGDTVTKTIKVKNTGTLNTAYTINWTKLINTISNDELVATATCTSVIETEDSTTNGTCDAIEETVIVESQTEITSSLKEGISILPGETHTYELLITFKETGSDQNYNQGKRFSAVINIIEEENEISTLWYDNCKENNDLRCNILNKETSVLSDENIDFSKKSSDTNGKGLYYTNNNTDENNDGINGRIYYYRGEVENNYIVFADHCWRIVRTNEDGTVRLRYGGVANLNNGAYTCFNTGTKVNIATGAAYNYIFDSLYVGYTYDTSNTNSEIKTIIDNWYVNNIENHDDAILVANGIYCNDRSSTETSDLIYGSANRLVNTNDLIAKTDASPQFACPNPVNDGYTTANSNNFGNGFLSKPVALLTADELVYSGAAYGENNTQFYMYTSEDYWTMSPFNYNGFVATMFILNSNGTFDYYGLASELPTVVPVISIVGNVEINGTGLYNDPYVVVE